MTTNDRKVDAPVTSLILILISVACLVIGALAYLCLRDPGVAIAAAQADNPRKVSGPRLSYQPQSIGWPAEGHPLIAQVAMADLDGDGLLDILVCDCLANRVSWIRQFPRGVFTESPLGDPVAAPVHVSVCDINGDGKPDLLVASMGVVMPNNDLIGSVIVMENLGGNRFRNRVLLENVARVTDVRGVDLNADGKIDLVIGQFGYLQGEIRWMENLGDWKFRSHLLSHQPGTIMTPVADYDRDGKPDFAALISQDAEEVHLFRNLGAGEFDDHVLWKARDESWGSSGIEVCDLNRDGYPDLLMSNGDGFNVGFAAVSPWHGLQWLENQKGNFVYHRIGDMPGCYSPVGVDLDGDGHIDVIAVSGFNNTTDAASSSLIAWMNDGQEHFTPIPLAHDPGSLITVAAGDLDGNGVPVLVTGGFHAYPPYHAVSRVTLWRQSQP